MIKFKCKKAQQLVEFLLVAPFLVIILGVLTEYAYALNVNMTLTQGLKTVTANIYSEIKPGMNENAIKAQLQSDLKSYMQSNNAPIKGENNLQVSFTNEGQTSIVMARYTYLPAFTLPNVYFKIMPDQFNFLATAAVPTAFLSSNNYDSSISSAKLDGIWSASNFSNLAAFNGSENGIMKSNDCNDGRNKILFLLPTLTVATTYHLIHWDGTMDKCTFDSLTGLVTGADCGIYNGQNLMKYLLGNDYFNVIFIHDTDIASADTMSTTLDLHEYWVYDSNGNPMTIDYSTDISPKTVDGLLKRALSLIDLATNLSFGNYDNIDASAYNPDAATTQTYTIDSFGSMIFAHTAADDLSTIESESTPVAKEYNFNY